MKCGKEIFLVWHVRGWSASTKKQHDHALRTKKIQSLVKRVYHCEVKWRVFCSLFGEQYKLDSRDSLIAHSINCWKGWLNQQNMASHAHKTKQSGSKSLCTKRFPPLCLHDELSWSILYWERPISEVATRVCQHVDVEYIWGIFTNWKRSNNMSLDQTWGTSGCIWHKPIFWQNRLQACWRSNLSIPWRRWLPECHS